MIAQCYNGAFTMSGRLGGLQTLMRREVCPMALYVHCWAHRHNSVVAITLSPIIAAVEHFPQDRTADRRITAQSIIGSIDTDFVICLQLCRKVRTFSFYAANYLQDSM